MIPDTMDVYVRNGTSPFAIIDHTDIPFKSSGPGLCSFSSVNVINNQQYYLQLKHRNSIETWSNLFSFVNDEASYSFIDAAGAAFGSNQIQVNTSPIRFAIYGGDIDDDGQTDATDMILVYNDQLIFASGYIQTDVTGDNFTDVADLVLVFNNANNFVSKITP